MSVSDPHQAPLRPRFAALDALRGAAILGVIVYHLVWDLSFLGFLPYEVMLHPVAVWSARVLVSIFLVLVGAGLVLAHGEAIRWRAFWRRLTVLVAAALAISVGTYLLFPDSFVFFGVLHAIALFSLLGLAFLRVPVALVLVLAALFLLLPVFLSDPAFNQRALAWIGFWRVPPVSNDLVPVFPWFGMTLLGIAGMRLILRSGWREALGRWQGWGRAGGALVVLGRWSLVLYLVHQPVLLGVLYPLAMVIQPQGDERSAFAQNCEAGCQLTGDAVSCAQYCGCALDFIDEEGLWEIVTGPPSDAQSEVVNRVTLQCVVPEFGF